MQDELFLTEQHPISRRHAILEDDGTTGWFYLTAPDERRPIADVWVYNRHPAPEHSQQSAHSRPPPLIHRLTTPESTISTPNAYRWKFRWSSDGGTVLLQRNELPIALLQATKKRGRTLHVTSDSPWGYLLSHEHLASAGL